MEIVGSLILLIGLILIVKGQFKDEKKLPLKELVKKTFPKYKIIEKHGTVMICEINHRNEPDELIFIRVHANQKKNIKKSGRMLIVNYPKVPTATEMKRDFKDHL